MRRISWFIFLRGGSCSGMTSEKTSRCWSITSSVVITAALICPLLGVQLILIPNLKKSIANPPYPIIAPSCFRNDIPIRASYFARFPTSILFPFVSSLPTARSTVHSLWLLDCDLFMAISVLVGSFISMHGIPWVVTKSALIRFTPIFPVSDRTFASFSLINRVLSSPWYALIVVGRVVFAAA